MLTAWYIGDHSEDNWLSRLGYRIIRFGQTAEKYGYATHCEAIVGGEWYNCQIVGASRRDGQRVRAKTVRMTPGNWRILSVPSWNLVQFQERAEPHIWNETPYSDFGAAASASMLVRVIAWVLRIDIASLGQWCSRFLGECAGVDGSEDVSVSELMMHAVNLYGTVDVTEQFFATREQG